MNTKKYTTGEVAELLGVSYKSVAHYLREEAVKPERIRHIVLWTIKDINALREIYVGRGVLGAKC